MNVENILKVADAIEKHSVPGLAFHMNYTYEDDPEELGSRNSVSPDQKRMGSECGAVACIIGWTNTVIRPPDGEVNNAANAQHALGLKSREADALFYPDKERWNLSRSWDDITPEQGVRVLRHLAVTGEIDWSV